MEVEEDSLVLDAPLNGAATASNGIPGK